MKGWLTKLKMMCVVALLASLTIVLTGCAGYVDGGYGGDYGGYGGYDGYYGGGSDVFLFGDGYGRGRDVRFYSQRGAASRGFAHSGGHGGGGHAGGGHGGGGGGHGGGGERH